MIRIYLTRILLVLTACCLASAGALAEPIPFTIPEVVLLDTEFASTAWGGSVVRTDAPGSSVEFNFSNLSLSSTGIKDDYLVSYLYGQNNPSHGNGDFSAFDSYSLMLENLDNDNVWVSLFINTGFTGPSGIPSVDPANDTFWQSAWEQLSPSETAVLMLDFDNAIPWGVEDNPLPHTQDGTDGVAMAINAWDRTELSAIGFQLYSDNNPEASILVTPYLIPEPGTALLSGLALFAMFASRRRNHN
ncbi:MAG: PEP-CTERM sorting domain-containing protein [Planctomycetes bacterium]|nr:PEP-CTERM sorting domain-containing protein [Planctomycetota bacterium]